MTEETDFMSILEAAKVLHVSKATVRRMIDARQLEAVMVRSQWRIRKSSVDQVRREGTAERRRKQP